MLPKCQIEIVINNISKDKAKVIEKALEPDNVDFPKGLNLEIKEKENQLNLKDYSKAVKNFTKKG